MMADHHKVSYVPLIRTYLAVPIYFLQYVVDFPVRFAQFASETFKTRYQLLEDNRLLQEENLQLRVVLQKFDDLHHENERLRQLLGSSSQIGEKILIAEVLSTDIDPFARKLVINKGAFHGVNDGQALLDAHGVIGQVTHVAPFSSIVTLITDPSHALPVQLLRTGLRTIAVGMGAVNRLNLLYLPNNADIQVGDKIVTSALGEQFPVGYPVGEVVEVNLDIGQPYAQVQAVPIALLERNREVLLVWHQRPNTNGTAEALTNPTTPPTAPENIPPVPPTPPATESNHTTPQRGREQ